MRKYDLAKMLDEIRRDEGHVATEPEKKKMLTQEQIKALARARRKPAAGKPPAK